MRLFILKLYIHKYHFTWRKNYLNSLDELKLILSKTLERKSTPYEKEFTEHYKSSEQEGLKETYILNTASLLNFLEIMHKEKLIDNEQFNSRVSSLLNIVKLVDKVTLGDQ